MQCTLKSFFNLNREENPDYKEEEMEEEDRNNKNAELEKVNQVRLR